MPDLDWAKNGFVWRLVSLDTEKGTCVVRTRISKKELTAKIADLRQIRKNEKGL